MISQSLTDLEVIAVNDGTSADHQVKYDEVFRQVGTSAVRVLTLPEKQGGHGGGHARNVGAGEAQAPYICFLDDDDCWTDPDHLSRAQSVLLGASGLVDLYMSNQVAFQGAKQLKGPIWIEDLADVLGKRDAQPDVSGAYTVTVDDLLRCHGFCHLNTLIVRRGLFEEVGGFEGTIMWEEDRDLYLRLIDRASLIKFSPRFVARHNAPDPARAASMTTRLSELDRRLSQMMVFERACAIVQNTAIRVHSAHHRAYALKRIVESLVASGQHEAAATYAREAFRADPSCKWGVYMAWCTVRASAARFARISGKCR